MPSSHDPKDVADGYGYGYSDSEDNKTGLKLTLKFKRFVCVI